MVIISVSFSFVFISYLVLNFLKPPGSFSLWFSRCLIHFLTANMPGAERPLVPGFTHDPLSLDMCAQGVQSLAPAQSLASVGLYLLDGHPPPALACFLLQGTETRRFRLGNSWRRRVLGARRRLPQAGRLGWGGCRRASRESAALAGRRGGCSCDPGRARPRVLQLQSQGLPAAHC